MTCAENRARIEPVAIRERLRLKYSRVYIEAFEDAFFLQLEELQKSPVSPKMQKYFLRNLLISLEAHFVGRSRSLEHPEGPLVELRSAAELMLFDSKNPVAREYLEELALESFAELKASFTE